MFHSRLSRFCIVGLAVWYLAPGSGSALKANGQGTPAKQPRKADFAVTAQELTKEFLADADKAHSKYKGKTLEITGEVLDVIAREGGRPPEILLLGSKATPKDVVPTWIQAAMLPEFKDKTYLLSRKQKVKLTGNYAYGGQTSITLLECSVQEVSKSEIIIISAPELIKEFNADAKAANTKYGSKEVIVSGEIDTLVTRGGFFFAKLKGDDKLRISVTIGSDDFRQLKAGKSVRLRGTGWDVPLRDKEIGLDQGFIVEVK